MLTHFLLNLIEIKSFLIIVACAINDFILNLLVCHTMLWSLSTVIIAWPTIIPSEASVLLCTRSDGKMKF